MKKIVSMLLSVVMLCSVTAGLNLTAFAAETGDWSDTIKYSYDEDTCELTLSGQGVLESSYNSMDYVKSIVIKDGITSIGDDVFASYHVLLSVTLPNNLLSIGDSAFSDCSNLSSIIKPES